MVVSCIWSKIPRSGAVSCEHIQGLSLPIIPQDSKMIKDRVDIDPEGFGGNLNKFDKPYPAEKRNKPRSCQPATAKAVAPMKFPITEIWVVGLTMALRRWLCPPISQCP